MRYNNNNISIDLYKHSYVPLMYTCSDSKLRSYYCQQLRRNYISYPFMYPDDRCFLLACYLTLSHDLKSESENEPLDPRKLFPAWVGFRKSVH